MKVSDITNKEIADYLKLDYLSLTNDEKADLDTLLSIAKSFIKSYTGLEDITVTDENVGTGDGINTTLYLDYGYIYTDSQTICVNGVAKTKTTDYILDNITGKTVFNTPVTLDYAVTASYKASQIDKYEDFVIVVYILCQDMHDNRTLYVDEKNLNKVVEIILGMHSINLL